jgi:hypothetical protein
MDGNLLVCTITDNGVGRLKAAAFRTNSAQKQGAFGLKLTRDRLAAFNGQRGRAGSFFIEDILDASGNAAGTKVVIKIKDNARD